MKKILVTGGAGYIGSHMVQLLLNNNFNVTVLDNLSNGHRDAVNSRATFIKGDIGDKEIVKELLKNDFFAIYHFAASIEAGESMINPAKYYNNNVIKTILFLGEVVKSSIRYFIFSSTAAVYGKAQYLPIDELHEKNPINIYGHTKLIIEEILCNYEKVYGLKSSYLRYFNACGADYKNGLGERHLVETHLIPLLLRSLGSGSFDLYGNDYPTQDGTCIRDYVHVGDICSAHLKVLDYMHNNGSEREFNIGTSKGYSILEVIQLVELLTKQKVSINYKDRRPGDPPILIASNEKAKKLLNWGINFNLENIVDSAWKWEKSTFQ